MSNYVKKLNQCNLKKGRKHSLTETEKTKEVTHIHQFPKLSLAALKDPKYTALQKEGLHL